MTNSFTAIVKLQNFSKNVALFSKPNYMNENMLLLSILYLLVFLCFNVDLTFVDICLFRCKTHVPTKQKDPTGIFLILFCFSKVTVQFRTSSMKAKLIARLLLRKGPDRKTEGLNTKKLKDQNQKTKDRKTKDQKTKDRK